ncbi:major facilitator superfamily domain-containing protein [Xylariales sp. AK1849]|nr:major facilitator superfamily domain-containing protein [Xylariales sp. AK1849]
MEDTRSGEETHLLVAEHEVAIPPTPIPTHPSVWRILLPATAVVFILAAGNQLSLAPSTAILEERICNTYYHQTTGPEAASVPALVARTAQLIALGDANRCKAEPVQSEISYILGWKDVFEELPAILLAMPFGILSDKIGRRKVMILAIFGVVLNDTWIRIIYWVPNLPIRLVWLSGVWQIIGAGAPTLTSVVFAQVADVCPAEKRSIAFSLIQAALLVPQIVFLPVGSAFISINSWIPMIATNVLGVIAILIAYLTLPETLQIMPGPDRTDRERQPLLDRDNSNDHVRADLHSRLHIAAKNVTDIYHTAASNQGLTCVLLSLFALNFGLRPDGVLLLLYASKRLHWDLDVASLLLSLRTVVTLILLSIILPAFSRLLLVRLKLPENKKNKLLTEVCGGLLAIGAAIIFLAKSWVSMIAGQFVLSAGSVFLVPARSLLAALVEQRHAGAVFTLSSVMLHGGSLVSAPIMAASFKWGMRLGDFWMGMPFLIATVFFLIGTLLLLPITLREGDSTGDYDALATETE